MPGSYSPDLRERMLVSVEAPEAVAERFMVGRATAHCWVAARTEGRRAAKPMIHGEAEAAGVRVPPCEVAPTSWTVWRLG